MRGIDKRSRQKRREERRSERKSLQAATCLFISAVVVVLAPNSGGSPKPLVLTSKNETCPGPHTPMISASLRTGLCPPEHVCI